jgi:hypothetical protein
MQQSSAILGSPSNARYTEMLRHTADITCTFLSATYYPRRKNERRAHIKMLLDCYTSLQLFGAGKCGRTEPYN